MRKILIISLFLILITGCAQKTDEETPAKIDHSSEITQLLKDNYLFSLYSVGNLSLSDAYVEMNNQKHYYIENEDIKNLEELNSYVNKVFVEELYEVLYEELHSKKDFVMFNDKFFVYNKEESCDIGSDYDFTDFEIMEETDKHLIVGFNEMEYYVYLRDGKYRLNDNVFRCLSQREEIIRRAKEALDNLVD